MATATQAPPELEAAASANQGAIWQAAAAAGSFTILDVFDHLEWFKHGADWTAWRAFLCAIYGLPMNARELEVYRKCTGRQIAPSKQAREVYVPTGRRARKSALAALMACWAGIRDYKPYMAPGERALIPVLAKSKAEAGAIKRFADAILDCPEMAWLRGGDSTAEEIPLSTGVDLQIRAANITAGRSRAIPFCALDEAAFFPTDDAAEPDVEIVRGIRPGMATIPGSMLAVLSSPYAPRGLLYDAYRQHYGRDGDEVLVWQADTLTMHRTAQIEEEVRRAYEMDPVAADSEFGGKFRSDLTPYISDELVLACTVLGRKALEPGQHNYFAFVDTSGGTQDAMALSIAHYDLESRKVVQDLLREINAPFEPDAVVEDFSNDLKRYDCTSVTGDRYAGEWPRSRFRAYHITYIVADLVKSDIYSDALPLLSNQRIELLDIPRLRAQLVGLDRRPSRSGRDSIDHRPGSHDDLANVTLGSALAAERKGAMLPIPEKKQPMPQSTAELVHRDRAEAMRAREQPTARGPLSRRLAYLNVGRRK